MTLSFVNIYSIMIDDILRIVLPFPFKIIAYADDLTVITSHLDPAIAISQLQRACDAINSWLESIKLSLNASKSVLVLFSRRNTPLPVFSLLINEMKIFSSQTVKFLGFILDAQLKWSEHISQKCVAAKRALFAVYHCLRTTWGVLIGEGCFFCMKRYLNRSCCMGAVFGFLAFTERSVIQNFVLSNGPSRSL